MQFSSIWPIDRTLSGATTPGQNGPGSDGNEGVLRMHQSTWDYWNLTIRLLVSYPGHKLGGGLTPLKRSSWCILQPQLTWQNYQSKFDESTFIKASQKHGFPYLPFTIHPYQPLILVSPLDSIQCLQMNVSFCGRPTQVCPCEGVHMRTSLRSLSLLLQQCQACLARLTWMVCEMAGILPYNCLFIGCCSQGLFKTAHSIFK